VGELSKDIAEGARSSGMTVYPCLDHDQALETLNSMSFDQNWFVLVKGSRGMRMEKIVQSLVCGKERVNNGC